MTFKKKKIKNEKLVSIITVVHNDVNYIENTIKSVINQSYKNIEYIIVDGGSTDGTKKIINKYKKFLTHFISEKDHGIYDAMNKGKSLASGRWVNFLNSRDVFSNNKVIEKINFKKYEKFLLIYGDTKIFNFKGQYLKKLKALNMNKLNLLIFGTRVACHQSVFYSQKFKFNFPKKYKLKGELFSYFECLKKGKAKYINLTICNYFLGGIGNILTKQNVNETLDILKKEFGFLRFLYLPKFFFSICKTLILK